METDNAKQPGYLIQYFETLDVFVVEKKGTVGYVCVKNVVLLSKMHSRLDVYDTNRSGDDHDQVKQPKQKLWFLRVRKSKELKRVKEA